MFDNCNSNTNGERLFYHAIEPQIRTIFDVGSRYDSEFTAFHGIVHYFDPVDEYIDRLQQKSNHNIKSYFNPFGLSNSTGTISYYPKFQSFHNRTLTCKSDDEQNKKILNIRRGIDYIRESEISQVDFMKIDTEGHELEVMKGFEGFLQNVKIIQFEYGGTYIDSNTKLMDVIDYLSVWFKDFSYLSRVGRHPITDFKDHYRYCNIVCFNKENGGTISI